MNKEISSAALAGSDRLRPLKWNELVRRGDFVANDQQRGFELWEGPGGFRADAFVKQIYRQLGRRSAGAKKSK
jgi:hypothetical protein